MERCSHLTPAPPRPAPQLLQAATIRRHKFPPLHERATPAIWPIWPAEKARLLAYLHTGRFDTAARLCGCSRNTVSRTWDRFRRDIAEASVGDQEPVLYHTSYTPPPSETAREIADRNGCIRAHCNAWLARSAQ
jgi:predicted DNA-binding protein (UPF0251 family)